MAPKRQGPLTCNQANEWQHLGVFSELDSIQACFNPEYFLKMKSPKYPKEWWHISLNTFWFKACFVYMRIWKNTKMMAFMPQHQNIIDPVSIVIFQQKLAIFSWNIFGTFGLFSHNFETHFSVYLKIGISFQFPSQIFYWKFYLYLILILKVINGKSITFLSKYLQWMK